MPLLRYSTPLKDLEGNGTAPTLLTSEKRIEHAEQSTPAQKPSPANGNKSTEAPLFA